MFSTVWENSSPITHSQYSKGSWSSSFSNDDSMISIIFFWNAVSRFTVVWSRQNITFENNQKYPHLHYFLDLALFLLLSHTVSSLKSFPCLLQMFPRSSSLSHHWIVWTLDPYGARIQVFYPMHDNPITIILLDKFYPKFFQLFPMMGKNHCASFE